MKISAVIGKESSEFECGAEEILLHAGLRHGLRLPYECATGTCGSCKAQRLDGEIETAWVEAPGAARLKVERGEFLLCQARTIGNCSFKARAGSPLRGGSPIPDHVRGFVKGVDYIARDIALVRIGLERSVRFLAGQFMVIRGFGVEGFRSYSISNEQGERNFLEFIVKRKMGGEFTQNVFRTPPVGAAVELFGPLGSATLDPAGDQNLLCIAGSSGLAPMISILRSAVRLGHFHRYSATLVFGVRSSEDAFFLDEISKLAYDFAGSFRVTVLFSEGSIDADTVGCYSNLRFQCGMVHESVDLAALQQIGSTTAFVAGPPPMVDAVIKTLVLNAGFPAASVRYDKFG